MYLRPITLGIILLSAIWPTGCQPVMKEPVTRPASVAQPSTADAPAYYFFTAAQLELKKGDINEAIWLLEQAIGHDPRSSYLKLEMANLLLIKKDTGKALDLIESVLAKEPDNLQALSMAGRIYQQQQRMDDALAAFEKVLAGEPDDQNNYLVVGRIYWNKNDFDGAERVFAKMIRNLPDSYSAYYFYGKVLAAQGKEEEAETALLKSLQLEPSLEEPRLELLKIYQSQDRPAKITETYEAMLLHDPENVKAGFGLAEHLHKIHRDRASLEILARLAQRLDTDATVIATLFDTYIEAKQFESAAWAIEGMLKVRPTNPDLHYLAGVAADGLEDPQRALDHLVKVTPGSRFYTNAVVHGAWLFHDMGKIDRAIAMVRDALAHDPEYGDYYLYLGSFYEELERYEDAMQVLQAGAARDPKNARLHFRIGVIYDKMGRRQDSIAAMQQVISLTPNDAEALNYLGYTYADLGINLEEAETLIQSALKIKPDDGYIADSLGWVYFKRGQYALALKWLNKAVRLQPDDPTILEHLGDVHLKLDSAQKALNYYQRSLENKETGRESLQEKIRSLKTP